MEIIKKTIDGINYSFYKDEYLDYIDKDKDMISTFKLAEPIKINDNIYPKNSICNFTINQDKKHYLFDIKISDDMFLKINDLNTIKIFKLDVVYFYQNKSLKQIPINENVNYKFNDNIKIKILKNSPMMFFDNGEVFRFVPDENVVLKLNYELTQWKSMAFPQNFFKRVKKKKKIKKNLFKKLIERFKK